MSHPNSGMCRVAVHAGAVHADLTLPTGVPVATLVPSVVDVLSALTGDRPDSTGGMPYRLAEPGRAALHGSKTLAQHGIRDGAVLVLGRAAGAAPALRYDDPVEQVAAAVGCLALPWTDPARRLTAGMAAAGLSGVAGFVAVPGGPGAPNALLATAAAASVAALTVQTSGCGAGLRTALCGLAGLAMLAAVAATVPAMTGVSLQVVGAVTAAVAVTLIQVGERISVRLAGLARRPGRAEAHAAHSLLTGLVTGSAAALALSAVGIAAGEPAGGVPRCTGAAFAMTAGVAVALRARCHTDRTQIAALLAGGATAVAVALLAAGAAAPGHRIWWCATAAGLAGVAIAVGFTDAARTPLIRRGAELLQWLTLGALATLACWVCGAYSAVPVLGRS